MSKLKPTKTEIAKDNDIDTKIKNVIKKYGKTNIFIGRNIENLIHGQVVSDDIYKAYVACVRANYKGWMINTSLNGGQILGVQMHFQNQFPDIVFPIIKDYEFIDPKGDEAFHDFQFLSAWLNKNGIVVPS